MNYHGLCTISYLELSKLLLGSLNGNVDLENVESHSLGKRTALTNGDNVSLVHTESRRNVGSKVLVTLLVSVVLGNVVEVVSSDDNGSVHLGRHNGSGENTATDGHQTGEGALLVNVRSLDGLRGGLEAQANVLVPSLGLSADLGLGVLEDMGLLLVSTLALHRQFCGHFVVTEKFRSRLGRSRCQFGLGMRRRCEHTLV